MPSARTIKARTENIIKVMLKALGLVKGITIKKIPKTASKQCNNNTEPQKAASHDQYRTHSETIKEDACKQYKTNPEPKRRAAHKEYSAHPEPKKSAACKQYKTNPEPKRRTTRK